MHFDSVRKLANRLFDFPTTSRGSPTRLRRREKLVTTALEYLDALNKQSGTDPRSAKSSAWPIVASASCRAVPIAAIPATRTLRWRATRNPSRC